MNKLLIEVYLPAAGRSFDVFIPSGLPLREVTALVSKALSELSEGLFVANESTVLCDRRTGDILDARMTAEEAGLYNGAGLMLI
ncbi:MAG: EsaB/YukD family protein [Oscillospiraceae bacterium]|jgi:hypothetical protein|nr:EsaB/YukD family protein [Oscillospiraceae bacterium]